MAVYTQISSSDIGPIIKQYQSPDLANAPQEVAFSPISAGLENSNYWLSWQDGTSTVNGVLTLFEILDSDAIQQCIAVTQHLAQQGLAVPSPMADQQGRWLHSIQDKPAIICPRLSGRSIHKVNSQHAAKIGQALAQAHKFSQSLPSQMDDPRNLEWWQTTAKQVQGDLDSDQQHWLAKSIQQQQQQRQQWLDLPHGWIHGDCFRDNVLFTENANQTEIGAILDWYNACTGPYLYDLAIVYLDWCVDDQGISDTELSHALLAGYQSQRALTPNEQQAWPLVCRAAALRFWLSRLVAQEQAKTNHIELPADRHPEAYYRRLQAMWN